MLMLERPLSHYWTSTLNSINIAMTAIDTPDKQFKIIIIPLLVCIHTVLFLYSKVKTGRRPLYNLWKPMLVVRGCRKVFWSRQNGVTGRRPGGMSHWGLYIIRVNHFLKSTLNEDEATVPTALWTLHRARAPGYRSQICYPFRGLSVDLSAEYENLIPFPPPYFPVFDTLNPKKTGGGGA